MGFRQLVQCEECAFAPFERGFDGVGEADADFIVDDKAVHNGFDSVPLLGIELDADAVSDFDDVAIFIEMLEAGIRIGLERSLIELHVLTWPISLAVR